MRWSFPLLAVASLLVLASCGPSTDDASEQATLTSTEDQAFASVVLAAQGPGCSVPLTKCNGKCVNLQTDPSNCGICGNACDGGSPCVNGTCPLSCPLTCPEGSVCHYNSLCTRGCWSCTLVPRHGKKP